MTAQNNTYYHKLIEEAFADVYKAIQDMMKDLYTLNMPEFAMLAVFPDEIKWSQCHSVANLNLKEKELSDEQRGKLEAISMETFFTMRLIQSG